MNDFVNVLAMTGLFIILYLLIFGISGVVGLILMPDSSDRWNRPIISWVVTALFGTVMVVVCLHVKGYI